ncbi:MAG: SRPBCC domain-containing protein [Planctomycetota bacterium]
MTTLPHSLDRSIVIRAPREVVFRYFSDSERFARWWGAGSSIESRVGGEVKIVYPNQVIARGAVTMVRAGSGIAFTYGYEDPSKPIRPGGSLVTIELTDHPEGTLVKLRHDLPTQADRELHVPGWRFQLALFANVVANEQHAGLAEHVDRWFSAWAEVDAQKRDALLTLCATDAVRMLDKYSCLTGREDLSAHIGMCHQFMPGVVMRREGDPRQCQGTALVDWTASDAKGNPAGKGTNVLSLSPDGRIAGVVGL